jgi:AcrR family transcriptional regulator
VTTSRRRLAPEDRRRQILATAMEILDSKPLEDITVEEAAQRSGVSAGLVFHYFSTQRKFRRALAEEAAQELLAQLAPDPTRSHAEQLHNALDRFTISVAKRPGLYFAITRVAGGNQDLRDLHAGIRTTMGEWLVEALRDVGVPATNKLSATVAGWLAYSEEVVLGWLIQQEMTREEVVSLCETACYRLVQAVVADPVCWGQVEKALTKTPEILITD